MKKHHNNSDHIRTLPLAGPVPSAPGEHAWHSLMGMALAEAQKAQSMTPVPEVPVGAIIVSARGEIIAQSHNETIIRHDATAHAEILALRRAGKKLGNYRLNDCILIVTLEPCLMCTGALVHSRIAGLVYGAADKKAGCISSCMEGLESPFLNHKIWHMGGVRSAECAQLLTDFFAQKKC